MKGYSGLARNGPTETGEKMSSGRKAYCFSVVAIIDGADDEGRSGEAGERLAQVRDKRVDDTRRLAAGVACRGARRAVGNPAGRGEEV